MKTLDQHMVEHPILHVVSAKVVGPHMLRVEFNDGVVKQVDLGPLLKGPVFQPLRDPRFFAQVRVDPESKTVTWPNGADLAPEALYELEPCEVARVGK